MDQTPTPSINRDKLFADAKVVLDDVDALLKEAASATGQRAEQLREQAAEALHRAMRETDGWVHANPWPAVGIAAGVAFLLGLLISRR